MMTGLTPAYDEAIALAAATPMTMSGLGRWGWLTIQLHKKVIAQLDPRKPQ